MPAQYKDSFFKSIFCSKRPLLDLYNALHNTQYDEQTEVVITTLTDSFYSAQKNDLAFLLDRKLILMAEHQSTINENMPFRFLQSIGRIFENGIPDKHTIYQKKRITLPRPEFIVLYNGKEPLAERSTLQLSEAFEQVAGFEEIKLELEVAVYNINPGYNEGIVARSEELRGYVYFVEQVRRHEAEEQRFGTPKEQVTLIALRKGIADCKSAGLLTGFWEGMTKEDERMLCEEWDWNVAIEVSRREAREAGIEEGIQKGREEGIALEQNRILELLSQGYTIEAIKRELTLQ